MTDGEPQAFYRGVRSCIAWLHERAREMNDPHAKAVLNSAAFNLGTRKPDAGPAEARSGQPVRDLDPALWASR